MAHGMGWGRDGGGEGGGVKVSEFHSKRRFKGVPEGLVGTWQVPRGASSGLNG